MLTVNGRGEDREKEQKDEKKRRREGQQQIAINNAGLANHI